MSIPMSYLIDDAAIAIGDPNKTRVKLTEWISFANRSMRELSAKADVFQVRDTFNLGAQAVYHWPDSMRRMTRMEVSETPTDEDSWTPLNEIFEDEWRGMTSGRYADNTLPESYYAAVLGFYLYPRPTATIVNGGRITYFGSPSRITDATADFPMLEIAQDLVLNRMVVFGLQARNRVAEAEEQLKRFFVDAEGLQDSLEDRSDDRRSSLAPRRSRYNGMR